MHQIPSTLLMRVGQLKYLARTLTNQNSIYEEIKPKNMNKDQEETEVRECYLSSGAESFIYQFIIIIGSTAAGRPRPS